MRPIEREIRSHPFLIGLRGNHLAAIAAAATEVTFEAGQVILHERDPAFHAYLLTSGKVAVEAHSRATHRSVLVDTLGADDVLGWSWLFAPFCWHLQARAIEPTRAIALDGAALLVRCEEDHELGHALTKRMAQLLIRRLEAARNTIIQLDLEAHPPKAELARVD
jgi:CRP/FNR family transcriptional regulator, cyclic AMP receptor protein